MKNEKYLITVLNRHLGKIQIRNLTPQMLEEYEQIREKEGVSTIPVNHELGLLKRAYKWAKERENLISSTPFSKYDLPQGDRQRVRFLKDWEEKQLFDVLSQPQNRLLLQFVTIFHETLIRPINLCELELSQLHMQEGFLFIGKTKNGEPNLVPLSANAFQTFE